MDHVKTYEKDVLAEVLVKVLGKEECEKGELGTCFLLSYSNFFRVRGFE